MGRTQKQQQLLAKEIKQAELQITVGALYWHYKDKSKVYEVTGLGFLEADDKLCVIYQAQYGEKLTFVRPLSVWHEHVTWEGNVVPRFNRT